MFALFPLTEQEISCLQKEFAVYIVSNGGVNLSGFNETNLRRIVANIAQVVDRHQRAEYQELAC